jgi:hypothetical protein
VDFRYGLGSRILAFLGTSADTLNADIPCAAISDAVGQEQTYPTATQSGLSKALRPVLPAATLVSLRFPLHAGQFSQFFDPKQPKLGFIPQESGQMQPMAGAGRR